MEGILRGDATIRLWPGFRRPMTPRMLGRAHCAHAAHQVGEVSALGPPLPSAAPCSSASTKTVGPRSREVELSALRKYDFFGAEAIMLDGPIPLTFKARTNVEVYVWKRSALLKAVAADDELRHRLQRSLDLRCRLGYEYPENARQGYSWLRCVLQCTACNTCCSHRPPPPGIGRRWCTARSIHDGTFANCPCCLPQSLCSWRTLCSPPTTSWCCLSSGGSQVTRGCG